MTRRQLLRSALVAGVEAPRPARPRLRFVVAAILAFGFAGAGTGGIVATAALAQSSGATSDDVDLRQVQIAGQRYLNESPQLTKLSEFVVSGTGTTRLDLGTRPANADSIVFAALCLDTRADVVVTLGEDVDDSLRCKSQGGGAYARMITVDSDSLVLEASGDGAYALWAAWTSGADEPQAFEPSATQQYLVSDGVVTREEYLIGFEQFSICMTGAHAALLDIDTTGTYVQYTVPDVEGVSAALPYCYETQFMLVARGWARANGDAG